MDILKNTAKCDIEWVLEALSLRTILSRQLPRIGSEKRGTTSSYDRLSIEYENDDVEIYHSTTNSKLLNGYTGVPQIPFTAPSSQRHSSTSGITHMSPDREELTLFRDLFDGYDKRLRPALRKEDNVTMILGISVHQLIDIVSTWCMRYIVSLFDQAFVIK